VRHSVKEGDEQCDDGPANGPNMACLATCVLNVCGDGDVGPTEGCDDGDLDNGDGCSSTCAVESCGDGMEQGDEQCDDANMVETDGCLNTCKSAFCGDGKIQDVVEECDDTNLDDNDACTNACIKAVCGDKKIQVGEEECDDGNQNDNDNCNNSCDLNIKRVFVSSQLYNGNLGGIMGADAKCTTLATAASLPGTYKAWIATDMDSTAPAVRFTKANVPYVKTDGEKIADNWNDLVTGDLASPIDVYETGVPAGDEKEVWTNVEASGIEDNDNDLECGDWTSTAPNVNSSLGDWTRTDGRWTDLDASEDHSCDDTRRIYCFQQ